MGARGFCEGDEKQWGQAVTSLPLPSTEKLALGGSDLSLVGVLTQATGDPHMFAGL